MNTTPNEERREIPMPKYKIGDVVMSKIDVTELFGEGHDNMTFQFKVDYSYFENGEWKYRLITTCREITTLATEDNIITSLN